MLKRKVAGRWPARGHVVECEEGQTLVEYALILALVSLLSVGALLAMSGGINDVFDTIGSAL